MGRKIRIEAWDFPGGPVVKTSCIHCRGHRLGPWSGTKDPTCCLAQEKLTNKRLQSNMGQKSNNCLCVCVCFNFNLIWQLVGS